MPTKKNAAQKKIPMSRIIQHFITLPEEQRVSLLLAHFSPKAQDEMGEAFFTTKLSRLRDDPDPKKKKLRAYISDDKQVGGRWKDLLTVAKKYHNGHLDDVFKSHISEEEQMVQTILSSTFASRLGMFWGAVVKGTRREAFIHDGLASLKSERALSIMLGDPKSFATGKSVEDFAAAVAKTMDLAKEKSVMEQLREGAPAEDPAQGEKLRSAVQFYMFRAQGQVDPAEISNQLKGSNWEKTVDPRARLENDYGIGNLNLKQIAERTKAALQEIPETPEDQLLFQDAALQTCRDTIKMLPSDKLKDDAGKDFLKFTEEMQTAVTKRELKQPAVQTLREGLATEQVTLSKEKKGFFLSKTNTREFDDMTKGLRLFNAKLELLDGKTPAGLTPEEEKTVRESSIKMLFDNAKRGCYNYGCLKTKKGKSTSFVHDIGSDRFHASMHSLSHLNELGRKLHISEPAAAIRDEAQIQLLQNRSNKSWINEHAEDLAARTIYAQALLNKGTPAWRQDRLLEGEALKAQIEKLKSQPSFKKMVKAVGREGLADAMIQGVTKLAEAYQKATNAVAKEGHQRTASEISPAQMTVQNESGGLTATP